MRTHLGLVVVAVALVAADPPKAEGVKAELDKVQGTWRLVALETNGQKAPEEQIKNVIRTFKGDKYEVTRDGKPAGAGSVSLNPATSPKGIDAESNIRAADGSTKSA